MPEVYSLDRDPNSLDFVITPDPDQCSIFDYLGPDFDYESIRLESDVTCDLPQPAPIVYRDTGVPMGFRHWSFKEPIDWLVYEVCLLAHNIKEIWRAIWA